MRAARDILTGVVVLALVFIGGARPVAAAQAHALFTDVLWEHVDAGLVDYPNLCADGRLARYTDQLASTDPDTIAGRAAKQAFWINAYNAYTLKIVCDHYPIESINDLHTGGLIVGSVLRATVWHKKLVTINNELTTLNHIEHKILRPVYQDPRVHFALVCAARGCPPLRSEAYEGHRLDTQLDDQARVFLGQTDKNDFDAAGKTARISPIFSWFKKDSRPGGQTVLEYLARFLDPATAAGIQADPRGWRIQYTEYDWRLNKR